MLPLWVLYLLIAVPLSGVLGYQLGLRRGTPWLGLFVGAAVPLIGHLCLLIDRQRYCRYCKVPVDLYAIRCYNCLSQFNNPGRSGEAFFNPDLPTIGPTQDGWFAGWEDHGVQKQGDDWNG